LILLPNAYGFVDPLHSTGIAHGLSGVSRVAQILLEPRQSTGLELHEYDRDLRREIRWIDTLIAGCYFAMPSFQRFVAFSSFYFTAAIRFEDVMSADPAVWPEGFLQADVEMMLEAAETSIREISDPSITDEQFTDRAGQRIRRWNNVGLLDPKNRNRLDHTAAPKR
jgi:FADH2 O2-dependent halogenase